MKNDLFYRPDLKPERDYISEAEILKDQEELIEEDIVQDRTEELRNDIDELINVIDIIPSDVRKIVEPSLLQLRKMIYSIIPDEIIEDPDEDQEIEPDPKPDPYAWLFPKINRRVIVKKRDPIGKIIDDTHKENMFDIYRDFVTKVTQSTSKFMQDLMVTSAYGGFYNFNDLFKEYILNTKDVPKDLAHLSDNIHRMQTSRNQKTKLFNKLHNIDSTIYHLRAVKATHELRKRYYEEDKIYKNKDYIEIQSNDLLKVARIRYDEKYNQSLTNLYKYLNSTVILVDESLQMFLQESKCKSALRREGIDVLKEKETLTVRPRKQAIIPLEERKKIDKIITNREVNAPITKMFGAQAVVDLANKWVNERGSGSANPVRYSMELRDSDPKLNRYGDCSSFVRRIFIDAGIGDIGSYTGTQVINPKGVYFTNRSELQPGDLMFFGPTGSHVVYTTFTTGIMKGERIGTAHVGIYIGNNKFVDLSFSVNGIAIKDFSAGSQYAGYVNKYFIGAVRF